LPRLPTLRQHFGMTDTPRGRPPWEIEQREDCFVILDADRRPLYSIFFYKRDPPVPNPLDRMSWDEALRLTRALLELPGLRDMRRRAAELDTARKESRENWAAALLMIREAIETLGPPGILPAKTAVGPEPVHEAAAIVEALQKLLGKDR
jgi:hypothetical protein